MPKIAILGAKGFLGCAISKHFSLCGWEVVSLSRRIGLGPNSTEVFADLFDESSLKTALANVNADVVLSTAWDTEHGKFWTSGSNIAYRDATLRFANLCFESSVNTFIGLGTVSEYGNSPGYCNAESSHLVSTDAYSKSKIETGRRLMEIGLEHGKRTHWARVFQAFGPNEKSERFIPSLIAKLNEDKDFSIRTPNFRMDWIHAADIASAIYFTLENDLNHFVDIGTGVGTTVSELASLICEEFGLSKSRLDFSDQIPGHEKTAVADPATQLLSLGWEPAESLRNRIHSLH
jgi:nucleoside-diphosphate-sugar epimerase